MINNPFDANFYRAANTDLAAAGFTTDDQLFSHFQAYGLDEGRAFSPLADLSFYRSANSDLASFNNRALFNHLQNYGVAEGRSFSPFVDLSFYRGVHDDLTGLSNEQLFDHLKSFGVAQGRRFSPLVDLNFYRASNGDLTNYNNKQLFDHLNYVGVAEGKRFSQFFETDFYLTKNSDLRTAFSSTPKNDRLEALEHLVKHGLNESRQFSQFFDINYYRAQNSDLATTGILSGYQLLKHFEQSGLRDGRPFSAAFDVYDYQNANSDLASARLNNQQLYEHFQLNGLREGRISSKLFNVTYYLAKNADLKAAFNNNYASAYNHFVLYGQQEGRFGIPKTVSTIAVSLGGTSVNGVGKVSSVWGATSIDFNSGFPSNFVTYTNINSSAAIVSGASPGLYQSPVDDTTKFLTVAPFNDSRGTSPVALNFAIPINYFGLYWGTIDSYNSVDFYSNGSLIQSFRGNDIIALANGSPYLTEYVNFFASDGVSFDKIVFRSDAAAFESDNHAYKIAVTLDGDTFAENSTKGTVVGQLRTSNPALKDRYSYSLVDNAGGRFQLVSNQLQVANGAVVDFESSSSHSIKVRTTDKSNPSLFFDRTFSIRVTNVNEAPSFVSNPILNAEVNSPYIYNIVTTDPDAGDKRTITANNLPSWLTLKDNGNGTATLSGTLNQFPDGKNNITLTVKDAGGLTATQTFELFPQASLNEVTLFTAKRNNSFTIPSTPSLISFKIAPSFDTKDLDSINDAFEVALVDEAGNSLVHTVSSGRDAFFNWTEGEAVALGAGTSYNTTTRTVSLNLTGTKPLTKANLIFRLVNNDDDTTTSATITDFAINPAPVGTLPATQKDFGTQTLPSTSTTPNFNLLADVSNSFLAEYHRTSFNADTKLLHTDIALRNTGKYSVDGPLLVGVTHMSDPTITLHKPDGITPEGIPYYDFSQLVSDGKVEPLELTNQRSLKFYNPQGKQFTYDLVVLAQLNQKPSIQSQPVTEIIGGQQYRYDVDATDPNSDVLTYKLLSSPVDTTIDSKTGLITWNTLTTNKGNHTILVEANDSRGGVTTQQFALSVIDAPPNRPPVFTSTPIVDAAINTNYTYQALAKDADNDTLTFSLVNKPEGMTVNPSTGVVSWTPNGNQLNTYDVTLAVTDGKGGTAQQVFKVKTLAEPGNHAPIIISDPITIAYTSLGYTYDVKALDSDNDSLQYSLVNPLQGMTIDANTGLISWDKPVAGEKDVTVQVRDPRGGVDTQSFKLNVSSVVVGEITGQVYVSNGKLKDKLVYFEDFENQSESLAEWSSVKRDIYGERHFLGKFGGTLYENDEFRLLRQTKLTLDNLPEHDFVTVSFKLFILDTWDGNSNYWGPDKWKLQVVGGSTLLYTTFQSQAYNQSTLPGGQSYPHNFDDANPTLHAFPAGTGVDDYTLTGSEGYIGVYELSFKFDHTSSSVALDFLGGTTEDINNESWGLDDVEVRVGSNVTPIAGATIYADINNNGQKDPEEQYTTTDTQGQYSLVLKPGTYTIAQSAKLGWTQTTPTTGTYKIAVASSQTTKNVDFTNIIAGVGNAEPEFISTPPTSGMVDKQLRYRAVALDQNADPLTYNLLVKPEGMVIDEATGILAWKPTATQLGKHDVVMRVRDGKGGQDIEAFQINVSERNTPPAFTTNLPYMTRVLPSGATVNVTETAVGRTFQYKAMAQDTEGDPITYSLTTFPQGATVALDSTTGLFTFTPTAAMEGNNNYFVITATDLLGGKTNQSFYINVLRASAAPPNQIPLISSTPRKTIALGQNYFYAVTAFDPDNDPLTYTLDEQSRQKGMTIDNQGILSWTPNFTQLGANSVTITLSDGRGGVTPQTFNIDVVSTPVRSNRAPSITSVPNLITNIEREYQYNLTGIDSDGDLLIWSLDKKPAGMVIDAKTGVLRWQPKDEQIEEHTVAVRLTDAYGAFVVQEFTLNVTGVNTSPQIVSTPVTRASQNQRYTYTVVASDPENDALTYNLDSVSKSKGIAIDHNGVIQWTPTTTQVGSHNVEVTVSDPQGGTQSQTYTLTVGTVAINNAPSITSTPVFVTGTGSTTTYRYQVVATDPDAGDSLTYQLLFPSPAPTGMSFNTTTGLLTWANPTVGTHQIAISAIDKGGLRATQRFTLTARANSNPVISSKAPDKAIPGITYIYDIKAPDPNDDALTYSLDSTSLGKGMTIDSLGRLRWTPTTAHTLAPHTVQVTVSDGNGGSATETINLSVVRDTETPIVRLIALNNTVRLGEDITFQARATDNVKVASLQLKVDGTPVVLDANGIVTVKASRSGTIKGVATATDSSNNTSTPVTFDVTVIDPSDINAPTVSFDLSTIGDGFVKAPTDIKGTISDDTGIKSYRLIATPVDSGESKTIFEVDKSSQNLKNINGVLGKFDPSLLQNDSYVLRLEVEDKGGNISYSERTVDVAGDLKLGNFRLSFTDLTIPVTGIPITLTRTYDTLTSAIADDFGYGWRMEFRDTDLRTSLRPPTEEDQLIGYQSAFKDGTRVYITLPGGKREAFTFKPTLDPIFKLAAAIARDPDAVVYRPKFVGDMGVTSTLSVKDAKILHKAGTSEYVGLNGGVPYNPADINFGSIYVLTTKEGIVYEIDAQTGDLLTVTDTKGNKLTYSDAGITSSTGKQITFEKDAQGRIAVVKDPMGELISYEYNAQGDLMSVTDQAKFKTQFIYDPQHQHYLKEIIDPLNRTGAKVEYDSNGRLKKTLNAANNSVEIEYDPTNSLQTVKDALGNPTTYEYDPRGNVLRVVDALGHQTQMKYDDDNNLLQVTNANNLVTKYEYDDFGNLKSRTEEYCGCPTIVPGVTYYTYDKYGNMTTLVTPTGASMTMNYNRFGNLLAMKDGLGNVIQSFTYDAFGQVETETDSTGTTTYQYDDFGNVITTIDADNGVTTMEYYANGQLKRMVEDMGTPNDTSDDEVSTFEYDKLGREKFADYGKGIWVKYDYTGAGSDWTKLEAPTIGKMERKLTDDGKLAGWVTPDGGTPTFKYDIAGRLYRETDASGNDVTEYGYDPAGRLTSVKDLRTGATTTKEYDAGDRVIEEIDALKLFTRYNYNTRTGRLDSTERGKYLTNAAGHIVTDAKGKPVVDTTVEIRTYRYEYNGLQTTVIDPLGRKTTSVSDDYYLPKEIIYQLRDGSKFTQKTEYLYANNLQEAKDYPTRVIDIGGNDRVFGYDAQGRLKTATDLASNTYTYDYDDGSAKITSPTQETLQYKYDALGNLEKVTFGNNTFKQMSYRPGDNRLGTVTLPSGETIEYDYYESGQVKTQTTKNNGVVKDKVSYTYTTEGAVKTMIDSTGTTTYRYDSNNRLYGIDYANGSSISYTYAPVVGRLKTVTEKGSATATAYTTEYDYDVFGNLNWIKDPLGGITTMKYDVVNSLKERTLPNGVKTVYEYDDLDRIKSIVHTNLQGQVLTSVTYEREGIGEPSKITREDGSYVKLKYDAALRVEKESYYNASGTLLKETTYEYDASGKRKVQSSTTNGNRTFNYTAGYQLDTVTETGETENYDYDANGRLTLINRDGKTLDLDHDAYDHLTTVKNKTTGKTTQYIYDGTGNRIKAVSGSTERRFLVAPAMGGGLESTDLITDAAGNLISNYIYAGGSSPLMRIGADGKPVYYLTDAMGTVIGLADGQGASAGKFLYDAFGNILSQVGGNNSAAGGDFRFQGQWLESESGLYHFRARDYDPATGLFLSRDPVDIIETEPESFNPYQFVYNNPYVYSDPTGMFTLVELNASQSIQNQLATIRTATYNQVQNYLRGRIQEATSDLLLQALQSFVPELRGFRTVLDAFGDNNNEKRAGNVFEDLITDKVCNVFGQAGSELLNNIYFETPVERDGNPSGNGFGCNSLDLVDFIKNSGWVTDSRPDYIISPVTPKENVSTGQKGWLVGDFKLSVNTIIQTYTANPN
ncbi:putative Ig domain-containing protein [Scytonema sp. NUACC26]|uniref:putative Ig domain-containing protein n=1 Tax=Scytonema sp. NUACC26 TaxID=3140176 RepID=UPI0034DC4283